MPGREAEVLHAGWWAKNVRKQKTNKTLLLITHRPYSPKFVCGSVTVASPGTTSHLKILSLPLTLKQQIQKPEDAPHCQHPVDDSEACLPWDQSSLPKAVITYLRTDTVSLPFPSLISPPPPTPAFFKSALPIIIFQISSSISTQGLFWQKPKSVQVPHLTAQSIQCIVQGGQLPSSQKSRVLSPKEKRKMLERKTKGLKLRQEDLSFLYTDTPLQNHHPNLCLPNRIHVNQFLLFLSSKSSRPEPRYSDKGKSDSDTLMQKKALETCKSGGINVVMDSKGMYLTISSSMMSRHQIALPLCGILRSFL